MAICGSTCATLSPLPDSYSGGCGVTTRPGGIKRIWFVKCNYTFTDIASDAEWTTAQTNGDAVGSGLLMGQKPKGSFTKKRIASCFPEGIVGSEKTLTFQDYNADPNGGCAVHDFWNTILLNSGNYKVVYETCDGHVYGAINDFILEIDEVIEDNSTGSTYLDGTISWNNLEMLCPQLVASTGGGTGVTPI